MNADFRKRHSNKVAWAGQLVAAAILGMAAPAKFLGDPTAVAIFQQLHADPVGRLGTGSLEVLAVLLLLIPRTAAYGALLTMGLMSGALLSHVFVLGLRIDGDPSMFFMAVTAFLAAAGVAWVRRCEIPVLGQLTGSCELPSTN